MDDAKFQVHAGDDSAYIVFTYEPAQTIAEGQLRFSVAPGWSLPQNDSTGAEGYTYLDSAGTGAHITNEDYDDTGFITADISLNIDDKIEIHYGADGGGAKAPGAVPAGGASPFAISLKGTLDTKFEYIDDSDLGVEVRVQRSGGGMAEVSPMKVNAGDLMREIMVTYTADGQIDEGQLKLTIPAEDWPAPTEENVDVMVGATSSSNASVGDKMYGAGRATTALPDGLGAMDVIVDDVVLSAGDMVVFTYTAAMVQGTTGSANFVVTVNGGDGPGTGALAVGDSMTTVTVDEAAPGSGTATVDTAGIVLPRF